MKNKLILGAAFLLAAITESLACTNLIVGKGASVDGSVIVSYSADSYGMFGELYHYPCLLYTSVMAYQVVGTLIEWVLVGDFYLAAQDFRIGIPGMLLQIFGGYALLKAIAKR